MAYDETVPNAANDWDDDIVAMRANFDFLKGVEEDADVTDADNVDAAGAVMESDYNAQTVLAATSDNTPAALTIAASTLLGRLATGNIAALTVSQVQSLLHVENESDKTDADNVSAAGALMKTGGTMSGELVVADQLVTRPFFKDVAETVVAKGNTGANVAFDLSAGNIQSATVDQNTAVTFTNAPASGRSGYLVLYLTNPGAFTIDWTGGGTQTMKWENSTAPNFTASGLDIVVVTSTTGSTGTWYGFVAGLDVGVPS